MRRDGFPSDVSPNDYAISAPPPTGFGGPRSSQ
jgi:hypothetical protein